MTSQSPQRTRKMQAHAGTGAQPSREMSPSPSLRDRQRAIKAQSMPLVPAVMQMYSNVPAMQRQNQQPSPTISNSSQPSKLSSPPHTAIDSRDISPERRSPPPAPAHTLSQSNLHQPMQPPPMGPHSYSQPNINAPTQMGYPRPINRIPPPTFIEKNWEFTEELMADIDRADRHQQSQTGYPNINTTAPGMSGLAYAGGAASAGSSYTRGDTGTPPPKDPGVERVKAGERGSPNNPDSASMGRRRDREKDMQAPRDSPKTRERPSPTYASQGNTPERRGSPQFQSPMGTPGEHTAAYTQYMRRGSNASNVEPVRTTPPTSAKYTGQSPPLPAVVKTRTPDRSLPVQEEPEDDASASKTGPRERGRERDRWSGRDHHDHVLASSPTPSSDLHPEGNARYDVSRDRTDDDTLIEQDSEDQHRRPREESDGTPRSPTADLPDDFHERQRLQQAAHRTTLPLKHRNGVLDQMGLQGFNPATFEPSSNKPSGGGKEQRAPEPEQSRRYFAPPEQPSQRYDDGRQYDQQARLRPYPTPQLTHPEDLQSFLEDPATAYIQAYLQSPRPNAPIPPTPHSQTTAPSPSPLVSAMYSEAGSKDLPPFSPAPPVGSPYPFPFGHVRRSQTYSGHPNQQRPPSSTNYDPNHPSVVQEQLAMQMQMYALNNHVPMSDSTLSPSGTPFPAPGYNPWAFMQARMLGNAQRDTMSLQSSPSHEPIPLPLPPLRGRGLKKRAGGSNLREEKTGKKVPPPRVESTQPRETSPEPYSDSGEETAGEEKYEVSEAGNNNNHWVNGHEADDDEGEWVDEEDEGEDGDLLELEFHPSFVSNVEKRRRRWETRWEALVQAFQALDRQTDATLVLMASPSHSTKLHSLTSRSIRQDSATLESQALSQMRKSFRHIASRRRVARSHKTTLAERLVNSTSSGTGSDGSSESREDDLRRALEAALGSLGAMGDIYNQREARWRDEMRRVSDDREQVELLLRQALGSGLLNGAGVGRAS